MPLNGKDLLINIDIAGTPTEIKDGRAWSGTLTSQTTTVAVFNRAAKYAAQSTVEEVYTIGWLLTLDDAGQNALRAAARAGTVATLQFLYDGTNGFEQDFIVTERGMSADPDGNLMEFTATLTANDEPTIVGTGPLP